jgi:hypothetical protein
MDEAQYGPVTGDDSSEITAHACDYCGVSEVDSSSGTEADRRRYTTRSGFIKYRGSRVLHGSRNKCESFQWVVKGLSKAQEWSEDSSPLSSNNPDGWMLYLAFVRVERKDRVETISARVDWGFLGGVCHVIAHLDILA